MNGWTKFYADGSTYVGDDTLVLKRKASWRKSSQDNIVKVTLQHGNMLFSIEGPGSYWQSDEYESVFPGGINLIRRRIQRQIEPSDTFFWISSSGWGDGQKHQVRFFADKGSGRVFPIQRSDVGKWMTVEYHVPQNKWGYRITKGRI